MQPWTVAEVCEALEVSSTSFLFSGERKFEFISTDSRADLAGGLFVPLQGENFDGHDFVPMALEKGAAGCLWSRPGPVPVDLKGAPLLGCADTLQALQALGRYHLRHRTKCRVAAVTGSTGKTMTKDLVAALLSSKFSVHKTQGNFNNDIGLPLTLLALQPEHQVVVLEMAMRGPGQIRRLAQLVQPEVGIVTNIGVSHIELLGSQEAIADSKGELLECLSATGRAVLPWSSPFLDRLRGHAAGRDVKTFAITPGADFYPGEVVNLGIDGWRISMGGVSLQLPLPGPHLLEDFVAAWAAADYFGIDTTRVGEALAQVMVSKSRLEVHRLADGSTVLNDAYNAAPDSMRGALEVLSYAQGRRVAVLGDMLELGPIEDEAHAEVGQWVAGRGIEVLLAVGRRSQRMAEAARAGGVSRVEWAPDATGAAPLLRALWQKGDTLLLKASRGIGLDRLMPVFQAERPTGGGISSERDFVEVRA